LNAPSKPLMTVNSNPNVKQPRNSELTGAQL